MVSSSEDTLSEDVSLASLYMVGQVIRVDENDLEEKMKWEEIFQYLRDGNKNVALAKETK